MKQKLCLFFALLAMCASLSACGNTPPPAKAEESTSSAGVSDVLGAGLTAAAQQAARSRLTPQMPQALRAPLVDTASAQTATVMIYLIGSDLESGSGLATLDLEEMMRADLGEHVNVVIQTMGCHKWHNDAVSPAAAQRFTVENGSLVCQADDLGQLDSTDSATLQDFISYCAQDYPADRNMLILWDHGGGPVYGFGYDEYRSASSALTLDEVQLALSGAGVAFDFIGFDACLMGCLETAWALSDYADYLIASEDFVSGYGWEYQYWLTELGDDVSMDSQALGQTIVETYVTESEQAGDAGVLTMIDLQYMPALYTAWRDFAYANEEALTGSNYSWQTENTGRGYFSDWADSGEPETTMSDYYITDMMAVATALHSTQSRALEAVLNASVVCSASTDDDRGYTGLSVTLPYGDGDFYNDLEAIFSGCGFDADYVTWLEKFTVADGADRFYDSWDDWDESWDNSSDYGGWESHREEFSWNTDTAQHSWSHAGLNDD